MADFEDIMDKHFVNAGISADEKSDDTQSASENSNATVEQSKAEDKGIDLSKSLPDEQENGQQTVESKKPGADGKDSQSGSVNSEQKSGKEAEGKDVVNPGDLKLQDGTIVRAGRERRWYEEQRVARVENTSLKSEINTYRQKYEALEIKNKAYEEAAAKLGVADPIEAGRAMRLYKDLRDDPAATMKQLLIDLKSQGITLEGIGPAVDTAAILEAINQKLKPASEEPKEEVDPVAEEVTTFLTNFPDARLHEPLIAAVLEANPNISLSDAYLQVKTSALEEGYDWSKDLMPQYEAKIRSQGNQQQNEQKPIVNGKPMIAVEGLEHDPLKSVSQGDDWESIIKGGMKEAGLKFQ